MNNILLRDIEYLDKRDLSIITLFFGIYPAPYLDIIASTMDEIIHQVVSLATFAGM